MLLYYLGQLILFGIQLIKWTIFLIVVLSLSLAIIGKSLGIRKAFSNLVSRFFEWVSINIELDRKRQGDFDNDSDDEDYVKPMTEQPEGLIKREASKQIKQKIEQIPTRSKVFTFADDSMDFIKAGMEAIIEDEVTCRFSGKELRIWNLLTRTSHGHHYVGWKYTLMWFIGMFVRYYILFPVRFIIFVIGMLFLITSTAIIGYIPEGKFKRWCNINVMLMSFRILARSLSIVATYHNRENMAKPGGICVANHTSPLDVQVLSMDNICAFVGQKHGGLMGVIQRALSRASEHVWFERTETKDRQAVSRRLKEHVEDVNRRPILIFPEGTCINNTSIMMFKKGSFEVGGTIYPAALKYDTTFGEAFWNSSKQSYLQYLLMLMTSWAIVVEVWYLPPMTRQEGESGIDFSLRVKHAIASAGGLVELEWDGDLKRAPVKKEMIAKERQKWTRRVQRAPDFSVDQGDEDKHEGGEDKND